MDKLKVALSPLILGNEGILIGLLSTEGYPCSAMALAGSGILSCFDGVPTFGGSTNVLCLRNNLPPSFSNLFFLQCSQYIYILEQSPGSD